MVIRPGPRTASSEGRQRNGNDGGHIDRGAQSVHDNQSCIILHGMPETPNDRTTTRLAWARRVLDNADATLTPASSDASFRSYWRVAHDGPDCIVMDAPPPREDVRPWLAVAQRLADAGVHVPEVLARDVERGFLLIEDFGHRLYL